MLSPAFAEESDASDDADDVDLRMMMNGEEPKQGGFLC